MPCASGWGEPINAQTDTATIAEIPRHHMINCDRSSLTEAPLRSRDLLPSRLASRRKINCAERYQRKGCIADDNPSIKAASSGIRSAFYNLHDHPPFSIPAVGNLNPTTQQACELIHILAEGIAWAGKKDAIFGSN